MIVCELASEWNDSDPDDPRIARAEIDVFAHDPKAPIGKDYRLSIRRVLATGTFEIYRSYHVGWTNPRRTEVVRAGSLADVLAFATQEWVEAWGRVGAGPNDQPCDHDQRRANGCPGVKSAEVEG